MKRHAMFVRFGPFLELSAPTDRELVHPYANEFERLISNVGWSNGQAAKELGLHYTVVWKYRSGVARPSMTVLKLLAGITGQRIMIPGENDGAIGFGDGPRHLAVWEEDALKHLRKIPTDARRDFVDALGRLVDAFGKSSSGKPTRSGPVPAGARSADSPRPDATRDDQTPRPASDITVDPASTTAKAIAWRHVADLISARDDEAAATPTTPAASDADAPPRRASTAPASRRSRRPAAAPDSGVASKTQREHAGG